MIGVILGLVVILTLFLIQGDFVQGLMRPAYDTNKCYDSDGGQNYDVKGTVYGKMSTRSNRTQYTDYCDGDTLIEYYCEGNSVKMQKKQSYKCSDGVGTFKETNAVDTLVIVNTDDYQITEEDVKNVFKIAGDYWLLPKTNIKFHVVKTEFLSFEENCPTQEGTCDIIMLLDELLHKDKGLFPEYIVVFYNEEGTAHIQGGYQGLYLINWLDPLQGSFYEPESEQTYCNEFAVPDSAYSIPYAVTDYGHKFAACGYDEDNTTIISDMGKCKGEETSCIWKNGYQMCSNSQDDFYAQGKYNFLASIIFHELMHSYANDPIEIEHWGVLCAEKLGWDIQNYSLEEFSDAWVNSPFASLGEEYGGMCPYIWQQFVKSQQVCP